MLISCDFDCLLMPQVRKVTTIPLPVVILFAVGLAAQVSWHGFRAGPEARAQDLPEPPSVEMLRIMGLGDPLVFGKLSMLWLQAFDNQPGISIPFRELDYARVQSWLDRILTLDPRGEYPLLAASRLYAEVSVEEKQRIMLDFVHRQFLEDPNRRWRWLAHGAILAKHRLKDLDLALKYARELTDRATGPEVPFWARDMTVVILEDLGELESARILVGGLLESGRISDPHELRFLEKKLAELQPKGDEFSTVR